MKIIKNYILHLEIEEEIDSRKATTNMIESRERDCIFTIDQNGEAEEVRKQTCLKIMEKLNSSSFEVLFIKVMAVQIILFLFYRRLRLF